MRRKIAIFLGEIGREFQSEFVRCIRAEAAKSNYDLFIFANYGAYTSTILYDAGERDVINIPVFSEFDGVITLPDTFDIGGMETLLINKIKSTSSCPIVAVRNGSNECHRILFNDYQTTYSQTKHFIEEHNLTKICYMSGPLGADDAVIRLNGFKAAMIDSGLDPTNVIFEGDFWNFLSKPATDFFLSCYDGAPEAIIFANDHMAIGVCEELRRRGFNVPDDIKIAGYDEIFEGKVYQPTLSTVRMPTDKLAQTAFTTLTDLIAGKNCPKDSYLSGELLHKQSCGCAGETNKVDISSLISQLTDDYASIRMSSLITLDVQNCIGEEEKLSFINTYYYRLKCKKSYLCLCTDDKTNDSPYSNTMIMRRVFPLEDPINNTEIINTHFDRKTIIPESLYGNEPVCFAIMPIHHKNSTFGYLVSEVGDKPISPFASPYVGALATTYNDLALQSQFTEFTEIKRQNQMDPLTGIFNRRGLEQNLATNLIGKEFGKDLITFISVDLDNLKPINDTYGHQEGDIAIKTVADVLSKVAGSNGICARVGGDEFYVVIYSHDISVHESFIDRVTEELKSANDVLNKPYTIVASMGACFSHKEKFINSSLCIQDADMKMYEMKKAHKKQGQ